MLAAAGVLLVAGQRFEPLRYLQAWHSCSLRGWTGRTGGCRSRWPSVCSAWAPRSPRSAVTYAGSSRSARRRRWGSGPSGGQSGPDQRECWSGLHAMVYWATVWIMTRRLARRSTDPPVQRRWANHARTQHPPEPFYHRLSARRRASGHRGGGSLAGACPAVGASSALRCPSQGGRSCRCRRCGTRRGHTGARPGRGHVR